MRKNKERFFIQPQYTRFKTIKKLQQAFKEYPQQKPSTPQAFDKGLVADFKDPHNGDIVSAYEIRDKYKYTIFKVRLLNGSIVIIKEERGKFFIKIDKKIEKR